MTAAVLSAGGRATIVEAAEGVARAELGSDDVTVVEIVDRRPDGGWRRRRVAVVGPATTAGTPVRATMLHARLDRALRARGLPGLDATHLLAAPAVAAGASPDDAGSAATRRLSVVHALLVEGPAASPSGFTALGPSAPVPGLRGHGPGEGSTPTGRGR